MNSPNFSVSCNKTTLPRAIPRMLTIKQTAQEFGLPEHYIRSLARSGKIVATRAGVKILINADRLAEFLNNSRLGEETEEEDYPIPANYR